MMFCYNYGTNLNVDHCFCAKCGCRKRLTKDRDCLKYSSNRHYIRKSTFDTVTGRPEELFFFPESFGYEHRDIQVTDEVITKVLEEDHFLLRAEEVIKASNEELFNYFSYIISHEGLNHPPRD